MSPVWKQVYDDAIVPYTHHQIGLEQAWKAGAAPIRRFMSMQIDRTRTPKTFTSSSAICPTIPSRPATTTCPCRPSLPAFMLSELKTAFLIGFQIYLPFLILDMVIASVTVSMG